MTHDYKRNGTTDLFAALNAGTGEVLTATRKSHKANDVLAFFKWIDLHTPGDLEIHVVLDNLSARKAPPVVDWLAHPNRAPTPTSAKLAPTKSPPVSSPRPFEAQVAEIHQLRDDAEARGWTSKITRRQRVLTSLEGHLRGLKSGTAPVPR